MSNFLLKLHEEKFVLALFFLWVLFLTFPIVIFASHPPKCYNHLNFEVVVEKGYPLNNSLVYCIGISTYQWHASFVCEGFVLGCFSILTYCLKSKNKIIRKTYTPFGSNHSLPRAMFFKCAKKQTRHIYFSGPSHTFTISHITI